MGGDPKQRGHPIMGVHPEGADASALEHLLDGAATIDPGQGLFLAHTWRLHPDICEFTPEQFYEDRLKPREDPHRQRVSGPDPFDANGCGSCPSGTRGTVTTRRRRSRS